MDRHQHQLYLNDLARRAEEKHAAQLAASSNQPVRPTACTYQWWHELSDRETLTRCTKTTGHDGKHEHREPTS